MKAITRLKFKKSLDRIEKIKNELIIEFETFNKIKSDNLGDIKSDDPHVISINDRAIKLMNAIEGSLK